MRQEAVGGGLCLRGGGAGGEVRRGGAGWGPRVGAEEIQCYKKQQ